MTADEGGMQQRIVRGDAELNRLVRRLQELAALIDPVPAEVEHRAKELAGQLGSR